MSDKQAIQTSDAPAAIGPYSQAIRSGSLLFCSGQIPLDPITMEIVSQDVADQAHQVFLNLSAVAEAAGSSLDAAVKLTIFLTDLDDFAVVNEIMSKYFKQPYPARATIQVSALPKAAQVEVEAILAL
ncbi:MAG: RidA family protein [Pseudomonadales bacterium]|jgi:reactive intermediate/imine deaminase|uniref:RidA family protein n=1 Tax=OM182 bacterium TaxID=2510334 RepID=A0A520S706_9GAMM|nr:RidA family protein [Pseudomonadales bacterium]RZO78258.1 MAG: RidA family protein [OM182 bacterium]HAO87413.1 reactive intermediate/imine deaminase [Gammaproteobacteria bacterium]MBL6817724.1 RidA family protein [Pseudomonadales bacterium]MCH1599368.1 RidA family protein [Pseudomonadales bacterium]|tara:strand:- start:4989 stop:5372 length:384 start_codon:yes stop_codon:yes gene_type:complete